jgi:hypothetical protein
MLYYRGVCGRLRDVAAFWLCGGWPALTLRVSWVLLQLDVHAQSFVVDDFFDCVY